MSLPTLPNKLTYSHDSNLRPSMTEMAVTMATGEWWERWMGKGDRKLQNHLRTKTVWEAVNALRPTPKMSTS